MKSYREVERPHNIERDGFSHPVCNIWALIEEVGNLWCAVDRVTAEDGTGSWRALFQSCTPTSLGGTTRRSWLCAVLTKHGVPVLVYATQRWL